VTWMVRAGRALMPTLGSGTVGSAGKELRTGMRKRCVGRVRMCACVCACIHVCGCVFVHKVSCIYVCVLYICVYSCIYVCVLVYMCVDVCLCTR